MHICTVREHLHFACQVHTTLLVIASYKLAPDASMHANHISLMCTPSASPAPECRRTGHVMRWWSNQAWCGADSVPFSCHLQSNADVHYAVSTLLLQQKPSIFPLFETHVCTVNTVCCCVPCSFTLQELLCKPVTPDTLMDLLHFALAMPRVGTASSSLLSLCQLPAAAELTSRRVVQLVQAAIQVCGPLLCGQHGSMATITFETWLLSCNVRFRNSAEV